MKRRFLLPTICLALPGVALGSVNFVNGSFEDPKVTGGYDNYQYSGVPGWTLNCYYYCSIVRNGAYTSQWWDTPDGSQFMYIGEGFNGGNTISQKLALTTGVNTLSFLQADDKPGTVGEVKVDVVDAGGHSIVGGPQLFTTPNKSSWVSQSLAFDVKTAGDYTFSFTSVTYHAGLIDAVTVNAVPEPATMSLAAGALALVLRRRKKA